MTRGEALMLVLRYAEKCLRHSMVSRTVVQRRVPQRFTSRFWSLWCEGFAPHTANRAF